MVGTNEVKEFRVRHCRTMVAHRVDGVGNPASIDLLTVDGVARFSRQSEAQETEPLFASRLGHQQMPQMNRIKRSAVKSHSHIVMLLRCLLVHLGPADLEWRISSTDG